MNLRTTQRNAADATRAWVSRVCAVRVLANGPGSREPGSLLIQCAHAESVGADDAQGYFGRMEAAMAT